MLRGLISGFCFFIVIGCAHTPEPHVEPHFNLTIDSIKAPFEFGSAFLVVGPATIPENDLLYQELKKQVENALLETGLGKADRVSGADMVVEFAYEIADRTDRTITIGSAKRNGWISGSTDEIFENPLRGLFQNNTGSIVRGSQSTSESEVSESTSTIVRIYKRRVTLTAFDIRDRNKDPSKRRNFWKTIIDSEGLSTDWRVGFPTMISGAVDYIGRDTRGQRTVQVFIREEQFQQRLLTIKGEYRGDRNTASK